MTCILTLSTFIGKAQVDFFEGSWQEAAVQAKLEKKFLFVDCYTDWCYWCKVSDRTTFQSKEVSDFLNKNFISVKVDMEKGDGIYLGMKYRVSSYPTFLVFDSTGQVLNSISGYQKDDSKFIDELKSVVKGKNRYRYISSIHNQIKFPAFYTASFGDADNEKKELVSEQLQVTKWLQSQEDITAEVAWNVISRFDLDEKNQERFLAELEVFRKLYGNREVNDKVVGIAANMLAPILEKKDENDLDNVMRFVDEYVTESEQFKVKMLFRLKYAEVTDNWKLYAKVVKGLFEKEGVKDNLNDANGFAWNIYLKTDDESVLADATNWMFEVVSLEGNYAYLDTYASLLYKTHSYEEAQKVAEKAIAIGLNNDEKVEETKELLVKIKDAQKAK